MTAGARSPAACRRIDSARSAVPAATSHCSSASPSPRSPRRVRSCAAGVGVSRDAGSPASRGQDAPAVTAALSGWEELCHASQIDHSRIVRIWDVDGGRCAARIRTGHALYEVVSRATVTIVVSSCAPKTTSPAATTRGLQIRSPNAIVLMRGVRGVGVRSR